MKPHLGLESRTGPGVYSPPPLCTSLCTVATDNKMSLLFTHTYTLTCTSVLPFLRLRAWLCYNPQREGGNNTYEYPAQIKSIYTQRTFPLTVTYEKKHFFPFSICKFRCSTWSLPGSSPNLAVMDHDTCTMDQSYRVFITGLQESPRDSHWAQNTAFSTLLIMYRWILWESIEFDTQDCKITQQN